MNRFAEARAKELDYHERFYRETELFQPGSWLSRPVQAVMETLRMLDIPGPRILDLGCGVGRNSIPMALAVRQACGKVTCIDILPSAIDKLLDHARQYGVEGMIEGYAADVEHYDIEEKSYHFIVACSCLEHMGSEAAFMHKLHEMRAATLPGGINCIFMSTDVMETDLSTGEKQPGLIELNLSAEQAFSILRKVYADWETLKENAIQQTIPEVKDGKSILFQSQWITFIVKKYLMHG
ncbi:class I SAM-dependent methyltransferase [Paenibacillus sp. DMB20]|uniref:class I SAM-dependent methyltransferase n=1 Tax=Paenibacillus sp. DMB20 TaxID=1642570 RepID=UPI000627C72B|nr:class I SAM-dependent methyltransferase [Paenibacillus sp. DMB20]KKO54428.1 methyltransferase type 12 [Paenibacillus sp. DMB20]